MSVMAMAAHTGCNTVYGSTPANNPHPYPWMNSLFQDGITVSWLIGESFIIDHARRSVIPERLTDVLLDRTEDVTNPRDGADDVIDLGICPICEKTLKLAYPDAADVNGLIVHTTCVAKVVEQPVKQQLL
jgi:hypothetical protein